MDTHTITVEIPGQLWPQVQNLAREFPSLDALVATILRQEIARRQAQDLHQQIVARRNAIQTRTGSHPSAVDFVQQLRQNDATDAISLS
ncbi:hypothetical protein [Leptolyngbya sp. PCC 6406]|uniref:hypothetical protein n=1 Tax=Leptolyngbya sp. PCC 6406 TaxID=1173264 RepID=UPI0002AD0452|nr:hypothetical protein [Leptolyngbya sp. PCC 6406]